MLRFMTPSVLRPENFQVRLTDRPGWVRGTTRLLREGEAVFCAAGIGTVKALHGKTGDGSRLVQIGLADTAMGPFFAAASNVLLPPPGATMAGDASPGEAPSPAQEVSSARETETWLGESVPATYLR